MDLQKNTVTFYLLNQFSPKIAHSKGYFWEVLLQKLFTENPNGKCQKSIRKVYKKLTKFGNFCEFFGSLKGLTCGIFGQNLNIWPINFKNSMEKLESLLQSHSEIHGEICRLFKLKVFTKIAVTFHLLNRFSRNVAHFKGD
jgi:hypothetical protein